LYLTPHFAMIDRMALGMIIVDQRAGSSRTRNSL
jgi:hypothetical protein